MSLPDTETHSNYLQTVLAHDSFNHNYATPAALQELANLDLRNLHWSGASAPESDTAVMLQIKLALCLHFINRARSRGAAAR